MMCGPKDYKCHKSYESVQDIISFMKVKKIQSLFKTLKFWILWDWERLLSHKLLQSVDDCERVKLTFIFIQSTSYHVADLLPHTPYFFRVTAKNKHGYGKPSDTSAVIVTKDRRSSLRLSVDSDGKSHLGNNLDLNLHSLALV